MKWETLAKELKTIIAGEVLTKEPMTNHTTLRIGGPADILVIPSKAEEVAAIMKWGKGKELPLTFIGNGSNLLVKDGGISGLVVKLRGGPAKIEINQNQLIAEAGVLMPRLARTACDHSLSGLEFLIGIPGTVGGGVVNNAGAHGQNFKQTVKKIEVIDGKGNIHTLSKKELNFGYRSSALQNSNFLVTRVYFELASKSKHLIKKRLKANLEKRKARQPLCWPNAGSIFINPADGAAGYLIDKAGLKGTSKGGAQISEKHGNFIINRGGATAKDVLYLIEKAQETVAKKFGVDLNTEITVLGEDL